MSRVLVPNHTACYAVNSTDPSVFGHNMSQRKAEGWHMSASPCKPRTGVTVAPSSYSPQWLAVRLVISILGAFTHAT
jgi:hypothetical protein